MKYTRYTRNLPLFLSANVNVILKLWIDGSFEVHTNMRGHTCGGISMGRGFTIVSLTKQKLNARSYTGTEILAVDDCMTAVLWTRYWLDNKGYNVFENIVYQDNKIAILLENNGKASSSKRTKHINTRYYLVTYRIEKYELSLECCPTTDMIGYFMTKPTQVAAFKRFQDKLMGVTEAEDPVPGKPICF